MIGRLRPALVRWRFKYFTMIATLIAANGAATQIDLPEDPAVTLERLRQLVGGDVQVVPLSGSRYLAMRENAKSARHKVNAMATRMAHADQSIQASDYIAGDAVILAQSALIWQGNDFLIVAGESTEEA